MFCHNRKKKQVMVHKLILMELRMNGVSFQACFNIKVMLREKLLLRSSHTLGWTKPRKAAAWAEQKTDYLLLQVWQYY